jgi:hypothetical protein
MRMQHMHALDSHRRSQQSATGDQGHALDNPVIKNFLQQPLYTSMQVKAKDKNKREYFQ